jgi:outer membrane protein assembly factor BamB
VDQTARALWVGLLAALALLGSAALPTRSIAANVDTAAYNSLRDGWDSQEPELGPSALKSPNFQKLFSTKLAGSIYSQPLVYEGTLIATTEKADAYGLDPATGAIRWKRSFGTAFKSTTIGCTDLTPNLGSTSTPVIDPATGTVYMTTRLTTGHQGGRLVNSHWYLQAFAAATGEERPGFPVQITGTPYNTPEIPFNDNYQEQRPGLLLLNGVVYIAFASDCDINPYRGIVVGVNASSGAMTTMWSDESGAGADEGSMAGIWQSGGGLVSDEPGRIILTTGNGVSPTPAPSNEPPATLSESVLGLEVEGTGQLAPKQFFAPSDAPSLDQADEDLGSGGPIALPGEYFGTPEIPHLVVQVGKDGRVFLINADDMGGFRQGPGESDAVLQQIGPFGGVWGHPAAYGGQGGWVYVIFNTGGSLGAASYSLGEHGEPQLVPQGSSAESFGYASGSPIVTSDGTTPGSAVVWGIYEGENGKRGQLRAYGAIPEEGTLPLLWSGSIGRASKFSVPTAAEGRVYVGNRSGDLEAFGLSTKGPVQASPVEFGTVPVGQEKVLPLSLKAARALRLEGAIAASGVEPLAHAASPRSSKVAGKTAGPHKIAPTESPLAPGVLSVRQPAGAVSIGRGARLGVRVSFRPAHAGPIVGLLHIRTSAGSRTVTVTGYGTAPGLIHSASPLDFGKIATRAGGKYLTLTVANSWSRPERITSVRLPAGPYIVQGAPAAGTVLAPRRALTISIHFAPSSPGSYPGRLTITSDHGSTSMPVSGTALLGTPRMQLLPAVLEFGDVAVGHSRTLHFKLLDTGNVPLEISRAIAPAAPFSPGAPVPEGITIGTGEYLSVAITFTPTAPGPASAQYLFNGDDGQGYLAVRLSGRGVTR